MDRDDEPRPRLKDLRPTLPRTKTLEPVMTESRKAPTGPAGVPESRRKTLEPGDTVLSQPPVSGDEATAATMLGISPEAGKAQSLPPEDIAAFVGDDDDDERDHDIRIGSVLRGYKLIRRLGRGSMGVVYLGEHVDIGKQAAVKVLRASLSHRREVVVRFLQEARAASRIQSPHVVGITDFGETEDGAPFFVMELLRGETLDTRLQGRERMPWIELRPILCQALTALGAAHDKGVVHRDVKPENIMLAETSQGELVKVLDFGIAKVIDEEDGVHDKITRTGMIVGTAAYMSPEQAQSLPLDTRADLYSVGVIAYRAVTGRLPFDEDGFMPMVLAHATKQPSPPSFALRTGMFFGHSGNAVDDLIMKALEKSPDDRFQTAEEMKAAIESIDEDVQVVPDEIPSSPLPKILTIAALVLVLAMVAWLAFS